MQKSYLGIPKPDEKYYRMARMLLYCGLSLNTPYIKLTGFENEQYLEMFYAMFLSLAEDGDEIRIRGLLEHILHHHSLNADQLFPDEN